MFWDNDGVLVDTERLYLAATRQVLGPAGIDLTDDLYVEFFLRQGKGAWHLLEERGFSRQQIQLLRDERNALYGDLVRTQGTVMEGAADVLRDLHSRYVMGIVTSSRKDHFALVHRSSGLLSHVDFVLADGDYERHKPDPDPYEKAVERSGCARGECCAIEDSERGLIAAKAAGIACMVIPTPLTAGGNFSRADRVLGNIREVPGALAQTLFF